LGRPGQLLRTPPELAVLCLDIPIGLPERGPRAGDLAARRELGRPRGASVFPAPLRGVLGAASYREACALHEQSDGRRLSRQAFALLPKIAGVDAWLAASASARARAVEAHPELSFGALAGAPLAESKRSPAGRERRRALLAEWAGAEALAAAYARVRCAGVGEDDFLDACALAWTAERVAGGTSRSLPQVPLLDARGLPMRIVV
jgi:predicted RNase H-like nuclease